MTEKRDTMLETPGSSNQANSAGGDGVSNVPLGEQLRSFNRVFWIANTMEMLERLAYYGLRTVLPIYMVLSIANGGPEFDHIQKGWIYAWWATMQSILPVFTGGYADRYGYKLTVAVAIVIKIIGYLIMAYAIDIAAIVSGGASVGVPGDATVFWVFMVGALGLAMGTAIFKPGLQGILALQLNEDNNSTGWSVFYQLVNLGGFLGPYLAGVMRLMDWKYVFISCAIIVSLNYIFLFIFPEPDKGVVKDEGFFKVFWESAVSICEPRLMSFLVVFSGFWLMFNQLFDLLPNFIDDWVDSSMVLNAVVAPIMGLFGGAPPAEWGGMMPQEQLINLNAGMIMLLAFAVGFVTGKFRSMNSMIFGILISAGAIFLLSTSMHGWIVVLAIAIFSIGEMIASPTKLRYFSSIAPPGKKGLYLGYINATVGIGWALGSTIAGNLYQERGDKVVLARRHLQEAYNLSAEAVMAIPKDEVVPLLMEKAATDASGVRELLWATYNPGSVWVFFAGVGVLSMFGLLIYDQITKRNLPSESFILLGLTGAIAFLTYGWFWALVFVGLIGGYIAIEKFAPQVIPVTAPNKPEEESKSA